MATYAIGDVQGCFSALQTLLARIPFDPAADRLWLVGDLVNRGPESLLALRWAKAQGDRVTTVLGNHDLHLLAVAEGYGREHRNDTLRDILEAPDRDELLHWLRQRPLLHREGDHLMVHAGLLPQWTAEQAQALAGEVEAVLRGPDYRNFMERMYGNEPSRWDDSLTGMDRLRIIVNAFTRLRVCRADGSLDLGYKGPPDQAPEGLYPWFDAPGRRSRDVRIVSGHWSALGLRLREDVAVLDTGCLWGGQLTALRLEDGEVFQLGCAGLPGTQPID